MKPVCGEMNRIVPYIGRQRHASNSVVHTKDLKYASNNTNHIIKVNKPPEARELITALCRSDVGDLPIEPSLVAVVCVKPTLRTDVADVTVMSLQPQGTCYTL